MNERQELNRNLAQMLKGGVIMDVTTPEQAKIAEAAGACAVMALERIPADIRAAGGVSRMSDPAMIKGIQAAVSIPVMEVERTIQGDDGRQAVKYVREHAAELGVNPEKIGLMGFSAGGMVTCNVMFINDESTRPNLAAPIYGFQGTKLPEHPVPTFLCGPEFDLFSPDGAYLLYKAFHEAHLPAELHFIHDATHGEGLMYNGREWNEM